MGKRAKAHRKKVQQRNNRLTSGINWAKNQEKRIIMDLIEREIKNGQHDSDFMKSQGLSSEIIAEQAELIKEASDEIAEEITIEEKDSSDTK